MKYFFFLFGISLVLLSCKNDDDAVEQQAEDQNLATVILNPVSEVFGDVVTVEANVFDDGNSFVSRRGWVWSTSPNPELGMNETSEGTGTGPFTGLITEIEFNTTYFIRAFAINEVGVAYSDQEMFTSTNECSQNVYDGSITLTTQTEILEFAQNDYCKITGHLIIHQPENATTDLITDLTPLSNLRYVYALRVEGTTELDNLAGFENISVIFDSIDIRENEGITNLDGLESLGGSITGISIIANNQLTNIDGLSNITALIPPTTYSNPSYIYIQRNPLLQHINGLSGLVTLQPDSEITLSLLDLITDLNGLQGISGEMGRLQLVDLVRLNSIDALSNITRINDDLFLVGCDQLEDLSGLSSLEYIAKTCTIAFNDNLQRLDGLSNLTEIAFHLVIRRNSLSDFCALKNLFVLGGVGGNVTIEDNFFNPTVQDIIDGNCSI